MNCGCFRTQILNIKSNNLFYYASSYVPLLSRNANNKTFSNYMICANESCRPFRKFKNKEILYKLGCNSRKLSARFPFSLSSCSFHLDSVLNKQKNEDQKLDDKTIGDSKESAHTEAEIDPDKDLTLLQKFKLMYKQYWYVLLPVHVATSIVWYGGFFFAAKSGVDIVPLLEKLGTTERFLSYLRDSNAGYYGIAYAMYKIATPARYTVTLGGTTIAINYLKNRGHIKPVPTKEELKVLYEDKKDELKEKREEMREKYHEKKDEMKEIYQEKVDEFFDKYQGKAGEMRDKYHDRRKEFFDKYGIGQKSSDEEKKKR